MTDQSSSEKFTYDTDYGEFYFRLAQNGFLHFYCQGMPRNKNTGVTNLTADGVDNITNLFLYKTIS